MLPGVSTVIMQIKPGRWYYANAFCSQPTQPQHTHSQKHTHTHSHTSTSQRPEILSLIWKMARGSEVNSLSVWTRHQGLQDACNGGRPRVCLSRAALTHRLCESSLASCARGQTAYELCICVFISPAGPLAVRKWNDSRLISLGEAGAYVVLGKPGVFLIKRT